MTRLRGDTYEPAQGSAEATDAAPGPVEIIAAPGDGEFLHVNRLYAQVFVAATGGGGLVTIQDDGGSPRIIAKFDADVVGVQDFNFGDYGFALQENAALDVIVSGAVTTEASVLVTATGFVRSGRWRP